MDMHKEAIVRASGTPNHRIEVVLSFLTGNDVFAVLPTGYGKSMCYACLPFLFDNHLALQQGELSIVIVVCPLTAIIEDQVRRLGLL